MDSAEEGRAGRSKGVLISVRVQCIRPSNRAEVAVPCIK